MAGKKRQDGDLVLALARGVTITEAAKQAGLSQRTVNRRFNDAEFRQRVQQARSDLYAQADAMGYEAFLEYQLDYESIDDSAVDAMLVGYDTLAMTPQELAETYAGMQAVPINQLIDATILRAIYSERQLYERMVEFWTDHFSIDINDSFCYLLKTPDDRDVIRQYAMTTFPDLLNASARSAAMSEYLDNFNNIRGHAQENYARELMELHTLGVDNG